MLLFGTDGITYWGGDGNTVELHLSGAGYPDQFGPTGKSVENSTKLIGLEITGYRMKYSTALWFLELQIRCGRKV